MRPLFLTLLAVPAAQAAIIADYQIPASSEAASPTTLAPTLGGSGITGSGGFTISTGTGTLYSSYYNLTTTLAGAISGQDFAQFSISIPAGTTVSLSDLSISFRTELTSVTTYLALFATVGSYTVAPSESSVIGTVSTASSTFGSQTISITNPAFQNLTDTTVTFRLYGYDVDSAATGNFLRIDSFTLNGATVIPEPSLAILGAAALPLLAFRRKRNA